MIDRVRRVFRRRQVSTGFTTYLDSVQMNDGYGPTFDEARRDFRQIQARYRLLGGGGPTIR